MHHGNSRRGNSGDICQATLGNEEMLQYAYRGHHIYPVFPVKKMEKSGLIFPSAWNGTGSCSPLL